MYLVSTFYFSRICKCKVYSQKKEKIGRIRDLIVDLGFVKPKVTAVLLNNGKTLDMSGIDIVKDGRQYAFYCKEIKEIKIQGSNTLYLAKNMLDRQIVDINGRKVVRVNDMRLAKISTGIYLIAADVGLEGLLRRLSIAKPLKEILKPFHISIPSRLILWDDVETINEGRFAIKLSKESGKLATLHPSDLADIIEDVDKYTQAAMFASLDKERAADVLEEMEPETQMNILDGLSVSNAADVLALMPSDEVADILDELKDDKAEQILREMDRETSDEVRELMEYDDDTVGSIMSTDYVSFNKDLSIDEVLLELRRQKPELDTIFYLYVVNNDEKLIATVTLRDLVVSDPHIKISEIMNENFIFVNDSDSIDTLTEIVSKYNLLAVPVVDVHGIMLGIVVVNDVVYNLLRSRRKRV